MPCRDNHRLSELILNNCRQMSTIILSTSVSVRVGWKLFSTLSLLTHLYECHLSRSEISTRIQNQWENIGFQKDNIHEAIRIIFTPKNSHDENFCNMLAFHDLVLWDFHTQSKNFWVRVRCKLWERSFLTVDVVSDRQFMHWHTYLLYSITLSRSWWRMCPYVCMGLDMTTDIDMMCASLNTIELSVRADSRRYCVLSPPAIQQKPPCHLNQSRRDPTQTPLGTDVGPSLSFSQVTLRICVMGPSRLNLMLSRRHSPDQLPLSVVLQFPKMNLGDY